jgi:peroxiredoxin/mono/diheme cytochrome c family protein
VFSVVVFATCQYSAMAEGSEKEPPSSVSNGSATVIGRQVPNFVRPDTTGKRVSLADFSDAKLVVVIFLGTECPIGNAYIPSLVELQKQYQDRQVEFIGINSNPSDTADSIAAHVKEFKIDFPVLVDEDQVVADLFGARRTPEAFVLDARKRIRYRGRIDDRFGYIYKREKSRRQELEEAVKELLAGKKVSVPETEPVGCLITRRDRLKDRGKITYARHVSRIFQDRCANCHHPGTAAPFSLLDFEDARNWSEMIKETVVQRRMPPWNADPRYGKFRNDLRMTDDEIDTVVAWIDNGAPLGDSKDLPEPREYADGWTIGKPDVVFKMPREYTVQASGTVKYQYFVTPTNFKEDIWVQAAEARPGNRSVVHHIIVSHRDPKSRNRRRGSSIVGTAPGEEPNVFPSGTGRRIPAGSELVWQVHYTPTGKIEKDCSEVGLIFCKEPPSRVVKGKAAINFRFKIPAREGNHEVVSRTSFSRDAELLSLMPHMHLRGKDFRYTAHYPDGRKEILLNVPSYDFNWQHRYRFAKPLQIPKGTEIECVAHFDNSVDNAANPDPTKPVRWGDQTWEEMMIGFINYIDAPDQSSRE